MRLRPSDEVSVVYLCREPVDFRKGLHALAILVESQLRHDPFSSQLYVFCNRQRKGIKMLFWEVLLMVQETRARPISLAEDFAGGGDRAQWTRAQLVAGRV